MPRGVRTASASAGLAGRGRGAPPSPFAEAVLQLVDRIPPGKVLTYGDVAEAVGRPRAARAVGQVMRASGEEVAWQRVVQSTGEPAASRPQEALRLLQQDGCPLRPGGERVDLAAARWDVP